MNQAPNQGMAENPWRNREAIPYPKGVVIFVAAAVYLLSAMVPVFFGIEIFSLIALVGLTAGVIYLVRLPRVLIPILLTAFLPILLVRSFLLSALVMAVIAGVASGAFLMTATKTPWRLLVLPAAAWAIVYAITRDATFACLALSTLPATLLLGYATLSDQRRTTSVCYTLGGLLLTVLAIFGVYLVATYGSIDREIIVMHFANQRKWLVDLCMESMAAVQKAMEEQGIHSGAVYDTMKMLMDRELYESAIALIYNVLPALVTMVCSIAAFEAQSLLCGMYCANGMKKMLTTSAITFTMSLVSAILYLICSFITNFIPANGMFMAVMQNFSLMLMPGFFLIGLAAFSYRFRATKGGSRIFTVVLIVLLISCNPAILLLLLPLYGAISVILGEIGLHMIKKMQQKIEESGKFGAFTPPASPQNEAPKEEASEDEEPEDEETETKPDDADVSDEDETDGEEK